MRVFYLFASSLVLLAAFVSGQQSASWLPIHTRDGALVEVDGGRPFSGSLREELGGRAPIHASSASSADGKNTFIIGGTWAYGDQSTGLAEPAKLLFVSSDAAIAVSKTMELVLIDKSSVGSCGNGKPDAGETCDDGGNVSGDGCSASCAIEPDWECTAATASLASLCSRCGNGRTEGAENCDDGNKSGGDGCNAECAVEPGWYCSSGQPSVCQKLTADAGQVCGDGVVQGTESCDDGGKNAGDGCSAACSVEPGWSCTATGSGGSACSKIVTVVCGNGIIESSETCDDGNGAGGDGCSSTCAVEGGWECYYNTDLRKSVCKVATADNNSGTSGTSGGTTSGSGSACGNGKVDPGEVCDDGNANNNDGCSSSCFVEVGYQCNCSTEPCNCVQNTCGNGVRETGEACDDGNKIGGDGCAADCRAITPGWSCTSASQPNVCTKDSTGTTTTNPTPTPTPTPTPAASSRCGNGIRDPADGNLAAEGCDDGNLVDNDGCNKGCNIEPGWQCDCPPSQPCNCFQPSNRKGAMRSRSDDGSNSNNSNNSNSGRLRALASVVAPTMLRSSAVFSDIEQRIFLYGGVVNGAMSLDLFVVNLDNLGAASPLEMIRIEGITAPKPPALRDHAAVLLDDRVMVITGGIGVLGTATSAHWRLDTREFTWEPISSQGMLKRAGHAMVVSSELGGYAVYGGVDESGAYLGDLKVYRDSAWQSVPISGTDSPPARSHATVTTHGEVVLYVYGGIGAGGTVLSDIWELRKVRNDAGKLVLVWFDVTDRAGGRLPVAAPAVAYVTSGGGQVVTLGGVESVTGNGAAHHPLLSDNTAAVSSATLRTRVFQVACPAGSYADGVRDWGCYLCASGTSSPSLGSTVCSSCVTGSYSPLRGAESCVTCTPASLTTTAKQGSTNITDCRCIDGISYGDPGAGVDCKACPLGAECIGDTLEPKPGFTRSVADPTFMLACDPPSACLGGADSECAEGYGGSRCGSCATEPVRYYRLGSECRECPDVDYGVIAVIAGAVGIAFVILLYNISAGGGNFGSIGITLHFFQVNEIIGTFKVNWPDELQQFFDIFSVFSFNVNLVSPECSGPFTYFDRWKLVAALPLVFLAFFIVVAIAVVLQSLVVRTITGKRPSSTLFDGPGSNGDVSSAIVSANNPSYNNNNNNNNNKNDNNKEITVKSVLLAPFTVPVHLKHFTAHSCNAMLLAITLLWIPILGSCLEFFDCTRNGDGSRSLDADVTVDCDDNEEYKRLFPYAIVVAIFYALGTPLLLIYILRKGRREQRLHDPRFAVYCGTLYDRYDSPWYWFELVVLARKALLVLCRTFLTTKTLLQLTGGLAVCFVALFVEVYAYPFARTVCNRLDLFLLVANVLLLFGGLLFYAQGRTQCGTGTGSDDGTSASTGDDDTGGDSSSTGGTCLFPDETTEQVLILLLLFVLLIALVLALITIVTEIRVWLRRRKLGRLQRERDLNGDGKNGVINDYNNNNNNNNSAAWQSGTGGAFSSDDVWYSVPGVTLKEEMRAKARRVFRGGIVWDRFAAYFVNGAGVRGRRAIKSMIKSIAPREGEAGAMDDNAGGDGGIVGRNVVVDEDDNWNDPRTQPAMNNYSNNNNNNNVRTSPYIGGNPNQANPRPGRRLGQLPHHGDSDPVAVEAHRLLNEAKADRARMETQSQRDRERERRAMEVRGMIQKTESTRLPVRDRPGSATKPYIAPPVEPYVVPGAIVDDHDNDDDDHDDDDDDENDTHSNYRARRDDDRIDDEEILAFARKGF